MCVYINMVLSQEALVDRLDEAQDNLMPRPAEKPMGQEAKIESWKRRYHSASRSYTGDFMGSTGISMGFHGI